MLGLAAEYYVAVTYRSVCVVYSCMAASANTPDISLVQLLFIHQKQKHT